MMASLLEPAPAARATSLATGAAHAPRRRSPRRVRHGLVARLRREIALGTYPSDKALQTALSRLIDDVLEREQPGPA